MKHRHLIALALAAAILPAPVASSATERKVIGRSVDGRPIVSWRQGDRRAISGFWWSVRSTATSGGGCGSWPNSEQAELAGRGRPKGIGVWTVKTAPTPMAPRLAPRRNARRIDLSRNFPLPLGRQPERRGNSGPRPASEPRTRAIMRLSRRVGFDLAVWFHQPWGRTLAPLTASDAGLSLPGSPAWGPGKAVIGRYPGSAVSWRHQAAGTTAFVVELGPRPSAPRGHQPPRGAVIRWQTDEMNAGEALPPPRLLTILTSPLFGRSSGSLPPGSP